MASRFAALLIGVSEFDEPEVFTPLPGVAKDMENMAVLEDYGYDVERLSNQKKKQILAKIKTFEGQVFETFVLYLSTHGVLKKGMAYLIPADARANKNRVVFDTAISSKELMEPLAGIKAKRKLILLDTCHSGGFLQLKNASKPCALGEPLSKGGLNSFTDEDLSGRGLAVLCAARNREAAICEDDGSVFTKRFIETIRAIPDDKVLLFPLVSKLQRSMENDHHMAVFKCDNITQVDEWVIIKNKPSLPDAEKEVKSNTNVPKKTPHVPSASSKKRKRSAEKVTGEPVKKKMKKTCVIHKPSALIQSRSPENPGKYFVNCITCNKFLHFSCPPLKTQPAKSLRLLCHQMQIDESGTKEEMRNRITACYKSK